ncbi:DUF6338 family protein [Burkholderia pseudomallei]|uniref:DUF6338 family protein n=1 Tax=Burkholderia pseudomallei TaxID=28450 RepID=UPI00025C27CE|nr:DUF6338 family protein [Burkholderia pseudomallei]EIF68891.1 hypothetical protein BP354E_5807 [Burkholderia pseudomallei 354e]EIF73030.1 hypothetical protein BP354A_5874 [Burkholderia pseudomallei 354a]MBO2982838.1 hypothetical protein [Burkholderia pseudomallei]MBO7785996.1 hypothetical protein [Burkholderia pseudomallei]MBO7826331.1 hypothetical protein [Burkholderia pseudomallei]
MNVAFPAILIFLLLSPGIIFHSHYQPREVRAADMSPFGQTVIYVVLWGAVFDAIVMAIAVRCLGYEFHLGQLVRLLVDGRLANGDPGLTALFGRLDDHPGEPLWFFLWANAIALVTALLWRAMVHYFRLDHPWFPLYEKVRGDAPWNYLFRGIDVTTSKPDAIVVAALVTLKDTTLLYTGLLVDYELTANGDLDRIMIANAARRRLNDDAKGSDADRMSPSNIERFYPIEGDCLVLRSSEITTLNIKYLVLESVDDGSKEEPLKKANS